MSLAQMRKIWLEDNILVCMAWKKKITINLDLICSWYILWSQNVHLLKNNLLWLIFYEKICEIKKPLKLNIL